MLTVSNTVHASTRLGRDLVLYAVLTLTFGGFSWLSVGGAEDALSSSGSLFTQLFWMLSFACSLLFAALYRVSLVDLVRSMGWVLPLMFWILLSVFWSRYPALTIRRASREELELLTIGLLICTYTR